MTFGNLVYELRRRSQDLRQINGELITNLRTENGIRWSAQDIADFCNKAIEEALNLVTIYPNSAFAARLAQNILVENEVPVTFTNNKAELDYSVIAVMGVYDANDKKEYQYVTPERFNAFTDSGLYNIKNSRWFTVTKSYSNLKLIVTVNTVSTSSLLLTLLKRPPVFTLTEVDFSKELPIQNADELIITLAELKLRSVEGFFERVKQLLDVLRIYLQLNTGDKNA